MWTKKNIRLGILAGILLAANLFLALKPDNSGAKLDISTKHFQWPVALSAIEINNQGEKISLKKINERWILHDSLLAHADYAYLIEAIMKDVEVRRAVGSSQRTELESKFNESGVEVELSSQNGEKFQLQVYGDAAANNSYFRKPSEAPYMVAIPGYNTFIAGIFALQKGQWKSKKAISVPENALIKWELMFTDTAKKSLFIEVKGLKLEAKEIGEDVLSAYLDKVENFSIDAFVSDDKLAYYQGLISGDAFARLNIESIDKLHNQSISFYQSSEPGMVIANSSRYGWMLLSERNIAKLLEID